MAVRVTQDYAEVLVGDITRNARVTDVFVEALIANYIPPTNSARVTQTYVEVLTIIRNYLALVTQAYVEALVLVAATPAPIEGGPPIQMMG